MLKLGNSAKLFMYKSPETLEEEYPKTPRERLHHSLKLLAQKFPGRSVRASEYKVPVFSWNGAGSEKGGSAEHINYDKIIFLPGEKDAVAVSVGDKMSYGLGMIFHDCYKAARIDREYSALFMQKITPDAADRILDYYVDNVAGNKNPEKEKKFLFAMHKLLDHGTGRYWNLPLFAYDVDSTGELSGFFVKSKRFDPDRARILNKVDSLSSSESVSETVIKYVQGNYQETPFAELARRDRLLGGDEILKGHIVDSILRYLK